MLDISRNRANVYNFKHSETLLYRLINPAKNPIGRISKKILDSITSKVKTQTSLNLWKSTDEVINWFKTSVQKGNSRFIKFDICEFYPSITEELLSKALEYARSFAGISDEEADIILHCKNLCFSITTKCGQGQTTTPISTSQWGA